MKKCMVILALLISITACSTKMSYYFLDWAIEWEVDDYVSLDKAQSASLEKVIDKFIPWHQSQELGRYVTQLTALSTELNNGTFTAELWAVHVAKAKAHWFRVFEFAMPELLPIMATLTDEQVKQIIAQLKVEEQELHQEFAGKSDEELIQDSVARLTEQFDDWLGSVDKAQAARIESYVRHKASTLDMWLEYRHEWIRLFSDALVHRGDTDALETALTMLMTQPDELKSEVHKTLIAQNTQEFGLLILDVFQHTSDKQRKHFNRKLSELISDLTELNQDALAKGH